jgi:hypothetical protein
MFFSKIWLILITFLAAVAVTVALIAPRPAVRKLAALEGARLDRAQYAAEQMFKVDAHKWIDRVSKLGRDAILAESLDAATRGAGEYTVIHRTIQDRFRTLIPDLATGGIQVLGAVDGKGRVIARVGENDKEYGDFIGGAEVIADALRGYMSDDVWGSNGTLTRVAASPVLSKGRDRIVGAIFVGAETGSALVERLKKNLDVDIALLLRGKVIASSRGPGDVDALPALIAEHTSEIEAVKRTPALTFGNGPDKLMVVAAPFPGQAGEQQAYYALIGVQPANVNSLLGGTTSDDLKWGHFPWIPLALGLFAVVGVGLALQRMEIEAPLKKLRRDLQKLSNGDLPRIDDRRYSGHIGGLARDVNAAVERFTHAPAPRSEATGKDLNAILGPAGGSTFDLPTAGSAFGGSAPPPAFPPPPPSFAPPPLPAPGFVPPPASSFPPPAPFSAASLGFTGNNASLGSSIPSFEPPPPKPPAPAAASWQIPPAAVDESPREANPGESEATRVVAYDPHEEEEAHFSHIFEDFVARKRECGESTVGLTRDKFLQRLRDNKAQLVAKHNCRTVRFSVYIKDGKAALKATPVRD